MDAEKLSGLVGVERISENRNDNYNLLNTLIEQYFRKSEKHLASLVGAIDRGAAKAAAGYSILLKRECLEMGVVQVATICDEIEILCRVGGGMLVDNRLQNLKLEHERASIDLRRYWYSAENHANETSKG